MKNIKIILLAMCFSLFSLPVFAEGTMEDDVSFVKEKGLDVEKAVTEDVAVEQKISIFDEEEEIKEEDIAKYIEEPKDLSDFENLFNNKVIPDCNDERFVQRLKLEAGEIDDYSKLSSDMNRRKKALLLKTIGNFEEISASHIDSKENMLLANRVITTKINSGISEDNIRVCKGRAIPGGSRLYVVMYEEKGRVMVYMLNFSSTVQNMEVVFVY